jgi:drug/metabolite transporter (DMT)-like permease
MNPILALIIANVVWGGGLPVFKFAFENIPPFTLAFFRFFFASFVFLPFVLRTNLKLLNKRDWIEISIGSFFNIFINITFLFLGLQRAPSINASVISASGPLLLFFLSVSFLKEKADIKKLQGTVISLIGILIIIIFPLLFASSKHEIGTLEGNIFYFIATIGAVLGPLAWKRVLAKVPVFTVMFFGFMISALMFIPFMVVEWQTWNITLLDRAGVAGILYGVFGSSAIAYFLQSYGLAKVPAQEIGIFSYINPITTAMVAIPLLHEYPDLFFFLGSLFVFLGIYISEGKLQVHYLYKHKSKVYKVESP